MAQLAEVDGWKQLKIDVADAKIFQNYFGKSLEWEHKKKAAGKFDDGSNQLYAS